MENLKNETINALKWSSFGEILAKMIIPITNIFLARLLTPEDFGVIATITMVISFADMFSDSGFQKYIIQKKFNNDNELYKTLNVAFWMNFFISLLLWFLVYLFKIPIAEILGDSKLENVIPIAAMVLPITAVSSVQAALYKKRLNFRVLFYTRVITATLPLLITVPLAYFGFRYWSFIVTNIINSLVTSAILTIYSSWKPRFYINLSLLKNMLSFSIWSLIESLGTWLTSYIGTFIVGSIMTSYYVGLYKTSMNTINGIFGIIIGSITSVLFSSLAKLKSDEIKFYNMYFNFIKYISLLILPMAVVMYHYADVLTYVLLGSQWSEVIPFIKVYSLLSGLTIIYGQLSSEIFRAKGDPKLSVLVQILHLVVLVPVIKLSAERGFIQLAYARSFVKIQQILVYWIVLKFFYDFKITKLLMSTKTSLVGTMLIMAIFKLFELLPEKFVYKFLALVLAAVIYVTYVIFSPEGKIIIKKYKLEKN